MTGWGLLIGLGLVVTWALLGVVVWRLSKPTPVTVTLPPPVVHVDPPHLAPKPKPELVTLRLVSNSGRQVFGDVVMEARARKGSLEQRTADGLLGQFSAWYVDSAGVWWYRRVGVARES